ncbi:hypothetical protein ppKF707_2662 [Metapseudomonas furukawaii]|uniref:Uncharacterized protein n=1 Tax=Metapseudomonas furukawaii TaxID=1149133 RepID=A0AAD1C0U6_METFU|nr:hypothetical protein ppKF707_2662 [Pseudomonas furukawaii]BAU74903.1 hypothetical protein KF707C_32150 [Pseudomonas furukawaii]
MGEGADSRSRGCPATSHGATAGFHFMTGAGLADEGPFVRGPSWRDPCGGSAWLR